MKRRGSGILLHISSLPSPCGIGDLGPQAYQFADFLVQTKQSFWQILPLTPTLLVAGNSPYHGRSASAGNPLLISPELLVQDGLLNGGEIHPFPPSSGNTVDFPAVISYKDKLFDLAAMGVRDSKQLLPARREILARKILNIASDHYILEVPPRVIDELRQAITMNDIMVRCFSQVLQHLSADRAILDACDVNAQRFADKVRSTSGTTIEIIAEHKADENHKVVSAASILAKVRRDESIRGLEKSMSCRIGSGYPRDPETIEFLEKWVKDNGDLPQCARHTWAPAQRIKATYKG